LGVLYGGLGEKIAIFEEKKINFVFSCKICSIFGHQNPGFGSAIRKMPDPH
jgi:hypothetical protein